MFAVHKSLAKSRKFRDGIAEFSPSRTVQSDKERTDIRNIVKRAMRNGGLVNINLREGRFEDISSSPSYMEALGIVAQANALFEALPSAVRDRFGNDPNRMLQFLDDPANKDEAIKLGLVKAPVVEKPPEPMLVRVVPESPPDGVKK